MPCRQNSFRLFDDDAALNRCIAHVDVLQWRRKDAPFTPLTLRDGRMCGIVGSIFFRGQADLRVLERQRDTLAHRGPDSSGVWQSDDQRIAFGHRRLAIIDLTPGGRQPMTDPVTGCVITFNGEIYNFSVLKEQLKSLGHSFLSDSDTEVILVAYREWGVGCLAKLEGMFAFAIFDPRDRRVLLARDRAGEKPLYFRQDTSGFHFASELKALLADPQCPRRVRKASLNEYLAYGYTTGTLTMLEGLNRVEPAGYKVVHLDSATVHSGHFWELPETAPESQQKSDAALVDELQDVLFNAVRRQLVADVPVGVLLSGGVDSSLIAAIAASVSPDPIRTFTVRFPGAQQFDEGPFARLVASHLGTRHTELDAAPADAELLQRLAVQFDDPIADSSMIPTFLVSAEIRKHATVAIGGDGGDELFAGYHRYPQYVSGERFRALVPRFTRQFIGALAQRVIPDGVPGRGRLAGLAGTAADSIANAGRIFRDDERKSFFDPIGGFTSKELLEPEHFRMALFANRRSVVQRGTAVDFSTYMVDDVLAKVDRASMLSSLEIRAPFLDPNVVEFAFSRVPDRLRATARARKIILRGLGARLLPAQLDLTRKQGFSIPLDDWLRGVWRPLVTAMRHDSNPSIVPSKVIGRLQDVSDRGGGVGSRLFALLILRQWERAYQISGTD